MAQSIEKLSSSIKIVDNDKSYTIPFSKVILEQNDSDSDSINVKLNGSRKILTQLSANELGYENSTDLINSVSEGFSGGEIIVPPPPKNYILDVEYYNYNNPGVYINHQFNPFPTDTRNYQVDIRTLNGYSETEPIVFNNYGDGTGFEQVYRINNFPWVNNIETLYQSFFREIQYLDLSNLNDDYLTKFGGFTCTWLTEINLGKCKLPNLTNMNGAFIEGQDTILVKCTQEAKDKITSLFWKNNDSSNYDNCWGVYEYETIDKILTFEIIPSE